MRKASDLGNTGEEQSRGKEHKRAEQDGLSETDCEGRHQQGLRVIWPFP